jgi:hypothetical protein
MLLGTLKTVLNQSSFASPSCLIQTQESPPQVTLQMATTRVSRSLCKFVRSTPGSSRREKSAVSGETGR